MIGWDTLLISGSLLIIAIIFLFLWQRAEQKLNKLKR